MHGGTFEAPGSALNDKPNQILSQAIITFILINHDKKKSTVFYYLVVLGGVENISYHYYC